MSARAVFGPYRRCAQCGRAKPTITRETYDGYDRVVVGHQRCRHCGTQHLFSRRLTVAETKVTQRHLQPIRRSAR